jgi:hypothetical protein
MMEAVLNIENAVTFENITKLVEGKGADGRILTKPVFVFRDATAAGNFRLCWYYHEPSTFNVWLSNTAQVFNFEGLLATTTTEKRTKLTAFLFNTGPSWMAVVAILIVSAIVCGMIELCSPSNTTIITVKAVDLAHRAWPSFACSGEPKAGRCLLLSDGSLLPTDEVSDGLEAALAALSLCALPRHAVPDGSGADVAPAYKEHQYV